MKKRSCRVISALHMLLIFCIFNQSRQKNKTKTKIQTFINFGFFVYNFKITRHGSVFTFWLLIIHRDYYFFTFRKYQLNWDLFIINSQRLKNKQKNPGSEFRINEAIEVNDKTLMIIIITTTTIIMFNLISYLQRVFLIGLLTKTFLKFYFSIHSCVVNPSWRSRALIWHHTSNPFISNHLHSNHLIHCKTNIWGSNRTGRISKLTHV